MIRIWFFTTLGFLIGTVVFFYNRDRFLPKKSFVNPLSSISIEKTILATAEKPNLLGNAVAKALDGTKGTYSVVVKDLKTNEQYFFNEHRIYGSGSLYKLWVMAATMRAISQGEINYEDKLTGDVTQLNNYFGIDPEYAEMTSGTVTTTIDNALAQIAAVSHNYNAMLLSKNLGSEKVKSEMNDIGLVESTFKSPPQTTASDTAIYFEQLYKNNIVDATSSAKLINYLKGNTFMDGIPKYLPRGVNIAHKTGEIDGFKHDAGIVYSPGGDYIVVVLSESDNPFGALERIALISKAVYKYFNEN